MVLSPALFHHTGTSTKAHARATHLVRAPAFFPRTHVHRCHHESLCLVVPTQTGPPPLSAWRPLAAPGALLGRPSKGSLVIGFRLCATDHEPTAQYPPPGAQVRRQLVSIVGRVPYHCTDVGHAVPRGACFCLPFVATPADHVLTLLALNPSLLPPHHMMDRIGLTHGYH